MAEVSTYCTERRNGIDAQRFIDHYAANGWKVGRNPMRDWQAAVRTWEARRRERTPKPEEPQASPEFYASLAEMKT